MLHDRLIPSAAVKLCQALLDFSAIQPLAQLLAGLEEGDHLARHRNRIAGARVPSEAGIPLLHGKRIEAAQLDPITAGKRRRDLVEYRRDDALDVAVKKMLVQITGTHEQFRFGNDASIPRQTPASCPYLTYKV